MMNNINTYDSFWICYGIKRWMSVKAMSALNQMGTQSRIYDKIVRARNENTLNGLYKVLACCDVCETSSESLINVTFTTSRSISTVR